MRRDVGLARVPDVVWLPCLCSCSPRRAPPSLPSPHRWALPEYHKLVLAFLASYKPYVSADALLEHLTTLYTYLTLDVERRELCTASAVTSTVTSAVTSAVTSTRGLPRPRPRCTRVT